MSKKIKTKKKILRVAVIVLIILVILFVTLVLIGNTVNNSTPESTNVLSLEEMAEKENRDISDFVPVQEKVLPLEEIVVDKNNNEMIVPEPTNVPPLKE